MNQKLFVLTFIFLLLFVLILFQSCSKNGPSDADVFMGKLAAKTWKVSAVMLDDQDVTTLFASESLTIATNKTYTSTNAVPPIWKASGSFTLSGTSPNYHLLRDEGIDVTVVELDTRLVVEFQYDKSLAGGRSNSISGKYHFEFN